MTISDCPSEVFCTRFSPDGKLLATGCGDGAIRVFNVHDGRLSYTLMQPQNAYGFGMPCTAIRFRPLSSATKTRNVLLAVSTSTISSSHLFSAPLTFLVCRLERIGGALARDVGQVPARHHQ